MFACKVTKLSFYVVADHLSIALSEDKWLHCCVRVEQIYVAVVDKTSLSRFKQCLDSLLHQFAYQC